jgi:hypothetical protein
MQLNIRMSYENFLFAMLERAAEPPKNSKDPQDHVSFDIPLLIRIFELVREDIKTDMELHKLVERILSMKNLGVLTMDNYQDIASAYPGQDSGQMTKTQQEPELESLKKLAGL